jgi:hypothetical protein
MTLQPRRISKGHRKLRAGLELIVNSLSVTLESNVVQQGLNGSPILIKPFQ